MDGSVASEPTASPGEAPTSRGETKLINLALQGGGAHGASTWGILDRLLEDDRIGFDASASRLRRRTTAKLRRIPAQANLSRLETRIQGLRSGRHLREDRRGSVKRA
jgi:hypothetical protein